MRHMSTVLIAAMLFATAAGSQQKPDFSGKWTADAQASKGGGPAVLTVKQTADTLSMQGESSSGASQTRTYKLDGSESVNTLPGGQVTATAKWDGDKLVILMKMGDSQRTQRWSLADGVLTLENTNPDGTIVKWVYKRASQP
jgi:hypothetical protein